MKQKGKKLSFAIRKEEKGFSAQCIEFPGIITQADTKEKLMKRINDAVGGYFEAFPEEKRKLRSLQKSKKVIEVNI
jgi:predicted RNase H-like HicB family nuclease